MVEAARVRIDTVRHIETPEGVVLELPVAGLLPRALAYAIDLMIRYFAISILATCAGLLGELGTGLTLIAIFLAEWLYPVVFELRRGATPGKAAMNLRVLMANGTPVTPAASLTRNLLRAADLLPFGYLVGVSAMLVDPSARRLGDLAAGTVVVHHRRTRAVPRLPPATPEPVPVALSPDEQRAIVDFAARSPTWSQERREELVEPLKTLVGEPTNIAVRRLLGMARWIHGGRS